MKFLTLSLLVVSFSLANAQVPYLEPHGGGEFIFEHNECLKPEERALIWEEIETSRAELIKAGKLSKEYKTGAVSFDWPLAKASGFTYNGFYAISNYVDQDGTTALLDYKCNMRTYDGHKGTDIFTWPFPWDMVANDYAEVVAAAPGTIISKADGYDDDHCSCFGSWNAVYVEHADGSVAWYGHMKKGSTTTKAVGATVAAGEYLGIVASSGCSTGPHLHFEIYDNMSNLIDPYSGSCNYLNASTWWKSQPDDRVPTLNAVLTHDAKPVHGCPGTNEEPNKQDYFDPGDLVYFASYYRDQNSSITGTHTVKRPDGSTWKTWTHSSTTTYNASWWYWSYTIPTTEQQGIWKYEIDWNGSKVTHEFQVGVVSGIGALSVNKQVEIYPNPSTGLFNVEGIQLDGAIILVADLSGRTVMELNGSGSTFQLAGLSTGMYQVTIQKEDLVVQKSVVIE